MSHSVHLRGALILSLCATACGGSSDKASAASGVDNPHGYPACGNDPATQPSPCIDQMGAVYCKTNTGYPGDELALCDMDPNEGMLVHFGPKDYSDTNDVANYLLDAGGEQEFCMHVNTPNTDERWLGAYHGRMRPNSHHWIVTTPAQAAPPDATPSICTPVAAVTDRWLFGSQSPQIDVAGFSGGAAAPQPGDPDYGLSRSIPPTTSLQMDLHYINPTDKPLLREAWAQLSYKPADEVKVHLDMISWINLQITIPPLAPYTTPRLKCTPPPDASGQQQPAYLGLATAHAHQRLKRLSLYREKLDGTEELVYESHYWHEPGEAFFRNAVTNPTLPVGAGANWGATSGFLQLQPGESFSFECEYLNDQDHTVTFGDTTKDEMCNVFGFYYPTTGMWTCAG